MEVLGAARRVADGIRFSIKLNSHQLLWHSVELRHNVSTISILNWIPFTELGFSFFDVVMGILDI